MQIIYKIKISMNLHKLNTFIRPGEQQRVVGTLANRRAYLPSQGDSWLLPVVAMWK